VSDQLCQTCLQHESDCLCHVDVRELQADCDRYKAALEEIAYGEPHGDNTDDLPLIAARALGIVPPALSNSAGGGK